MTYMKSVYIRMFRHPFVGGETFTEPQTQCQNPHPAAISDPATSGFWSNKKPTNGDGIRPGSGTTGINGLQYLDVPGT